MQIDKIWSKVTAWLMGLVPVMALVGWNIEPATMEAWLKDFGAYAAGLYAAGAAAVHWLMNRGKSVTITRNK